MMHAANGTAQEAADPTKVEASNQIRSSSSSSPIKSADNKMQRDNNSNNSRSSLENYCEFLRQIKVIKKGCTIDKRHTHMDTASSRSISAAGCSTNYSYHRKLLIPLLPTTTTIIITIIFIIVALLMDIQKTNGAELSNTQHKSSTPSSSSSPAAIQKRYGNPITMDPPSSLTTNSEQPGQQIAAEHARRHLMSLAMADLMQKNNHHHHHQQQQQQQHHQHEQRSLWSQDPSTHLMDQFKQQQQPAINHNQNEQFVSYRPIVAASTMPTINRQIQPPNPFYELSFAPTNTLQIETTNNNNHRDSNSNNNHHHHHLHQLDEQEPHFASAMSQPNPVRLDPIQQQQSNSGISTTARSIELPQQQQQQQQSEAAIQMTAESAAAASESADNNNKAAASGESGARNSQQQQQQQLEQQTAVAAAAAPVDKIEPRQRRRLFNRILKKAEWNHLFVELSKVFLRYFLDLALKDIIGKQSGSTSSGSGSSETTSRKKLDAQSELADLLKDVVKNAIAANF